MKVLRAIGRFFARIGRWIRDTAWVQPLLIVGGIFAIIFSIPYLTNWVKSWFTSGNAANAYYAKTQISWDNVEKNKSDVDKLLYYLRDHDNPEYKNEKERYGDKFFLCFVQEDCPGCEANYAGFNELQNKWGKSEFSSFSSGKVEDFKIFSIFIDKCDDNNKEFFTQYIAGNKTACAHNDFFEEASSLTNPYMYNKGTGADFYAKLSAEDDSFTSPIVMLIDFNFQPTDGIYDHREYGVTEAVYEINGRNGDGSAIDKARELWDCWNHIGDFSSQKK